MKLLTDFKVWGLCLLLLLSSTIINAQATWNEPGQYLELTVGSSTVRSTIGKQTGEQLLIGAELATMYGLNSKMKKWESKYNSYLKEARGYAETMKAGTTLFFDGVRTFTSLLQVQKAVSNNPQGIGAALSMTDLYTETAIEFIKTYRTLNECVAKGGTGNMLNGKERNEMLWNLTGRLEDLNKKLHSLALAIAFYNFADVWRNATSGMIQKSHGTLAEEALDRWNRAQRAAYVIK